MVTVETKNLLDGQFTRLFKDLYIKTSAKPLPTELPYPYEMKPYLDVLYESVGSSYRLVDNKFMLREKCKNADIHDTRCLCAFSGGKDSVANALLLRNMGYDPILFFVKGINRSYPQEYETSLELAGELGMEIITYNLKVFGKCDFIENPTKNQFILALMVDYGVKYNIVNYSFGSNQTDRIDSISFEYMLSDCYDLFRSVEKFYKNFIEYFDLLIPLKNETEAFCVINKLGYDDLLDKCFSCMTPLRYKKQVRSSNEQKFGISLRPNRCGSCYKCCQEAIILNEIGVDKYDAMFIRHCNEIISKFQDKLDATSNRADEKPWVDLDIIKLYKDGRA